MAFYDPPKSSLGRRRVAANPLPIPPPEQANSSFRADKSPLLTKLFPEAARSASDNESNWQAQEMQRQREQQAQLEQRTREKIARREAELKARKEADEEAKARAAEEKALAKQAEDDRKAKEKEALIAENTAFETKARAAGLGSDLYKADDNRWRLPYGEEEMQARSELNKRAAEEEAKKKAIDAEIASLSAEKGIKPYVTVEETKQAEKDLEEIFPVARSKALGSIDAKAQEFEKRGKSFFGLGGDPVAAKEAEKLKAKYEGLISDPNGLDEEELNAADPVTAARYKTAKEKLEATKQAKAWHDAMETKISMLKLKRDNPAKWEELQAKELANAPDADLGKMSDEIKATDAGTTAQAQEREKLLQQNREKLSAGVAPGETVATADGQVVHKDLAPELEKLTPTKDPDADVKRKLISDEIQRRIAINDAKVKEYYGRLRSSPLYADLADKYEALDAEQATRLKEVDDKASDPAQYKEMRDIVIDDIRNKRNAIEEAKAGRIESEKRIFALADQYMQDYDVTLNAGLGRGDNTKIELEKAKEIISGLKERHDKSRDKLAKELGIDSLTAYKASEDYIQASKPWLDVGIDGSRILTSGAVMVNPKAIWDTGALEKAKEFVTRNFSAIGKDPVKGAEMVDKQVADMRERSSHEVFADLMDAPVFQKWLEKNKLPGDKGMTGEQKAGLILKFNQDKTWWDRLSNDAKQGLYAGLTDLQQGAWSISTAGSDGLYAATGLQYFRDIADGKRSVAEMYGRDVESLSRSRTAVGKFDLIPGISVGDVAQAAPSIAVSMLPGVALARLSQARKLGVLTKILTGAKTEMTAEKALQVAGVAGMRGATAGAFVQSFASSYGQARSGFMAQGMSRDEAEQQALWSATKAGLSTAALTRLFGLHGAEAALGSNPTMREMFKVIGKDGLRNSLKSPKFRKLFADSLGDLGMEAISEVPEESMDQFVQGLMEKASYNPDKTWKEVFDETMNAGGVALFLGGAGPLVAGAKGMAADATEKILAKGQSNPATPAANPATPAIPAPNTPAATPENIVKATSDIANAPPPADAADTGIDWPATQTAATAIVQIGTGNIAALSDDELKSVGLTRNDKGVIEQSQPGKDSPAPLVKMENGEPIILDAGTALLEQHFPDARQLIAQTEGERRAEIEAQQQQDQQTTTEDPSTPEAPTSDTPQPTDAGATESPPSDTATAAPPGTGPAGVDTNSLPDYEQQIVSILEESYGFPSDDAKAIAKDHLARRGVTKTDANGVPDAQMQVLEDVESELGQAGIQDVTEKTDGISKRYLKRFAKDRKAAETARATANEQRASALAYRLGSEDARVGLRSGEGKIAVRKWVRNNPVPLDANGNPDVDADFKAFRESIAAYDIPTGPSNPIRQKTPSEERAEQAKAKAASTAELDPESKVRALLKENPKATMAELQAVAPGQTKAWYADQKKAAIPKVDAEVSTKEGKTPGGQASKTASKATLPRNISTAVGKLPDALRPKALKLLKPLLETLRKYESVEIFSDIRFVDEFPAGTGGMRLAPDGALEIHLPTVANDSIKRIRAALSEEAIHAIAVRVIDKAQVVSLWNSLPKELQQAVRKVYFASYEVNGETLPEGDAFSMGHEAIRMMVQDKAFLGRITEAQGLAGKVKAILETLLSELRRMIDAAPAEAKRELEAARDSVISALEEVGIIESRAIAESAPANESPATRELSRRENAANKLRSMMGLPPLNASAKVTAEDDSRYLELAKDPKANRDTLQAMVDESAKAAGYDGLFFHGTNAVFNTFSVTSPPNRVHGHPSRVMGAFLTNRKDSASSYALTAAGKIGGTPRVIRAFVRLKNPKEFTIREFYNRYDGFQKNDWKRKEAIAKRDAEAFQKDGFDGISVGDGFEVAIFNPNQIKSADPVTYDETGNVIPLSQRFNPDAESILYAGEKPTETVIDYKSAEFRNVASELGNSLYEAGFTDPMAFASELNTLLDGNGDARLFGRVWTESEGYNPDDDQPKWGQLLAEIRKPVATEELETGYFKGDKVVFTDDPAPPGFRSFTYLEGPKVGTQGVQRTPEAKKADAEAQIKQFSEQQAAFKRLRDSGLSDQMPKTKEPSPAKAEAPTDSLPADGSTPGGVDQPVAKKTKARTIPTVKSKASEIIRSGMFETISALADIKIAPPSPAIPLIRSREKRGMKLSELEMKLLRDNRDYDGYPSQKSVMDRGDGGKVAAEILSRIMSGKERPDNAADFWRQGSKPSEMWDALVEELYAVAEGRGTAMDAARDSYEEGKVNEMEAQLDRFEAANRPAPGRTEIDAKTLTVGDKLVVDGEILTVSSLEMNQETGEADTVILDDHYRFGRQFLEGGDSVFVEEAWSGEGWNNYENAPNEAPQTQPAPEVGPADTQTTPISQKEAAALITKDRAKQILADSNIKDRPIRTYEQAVAANQDHMGTKISDWNAFPFNGDISSEGRPLQDLSGRDKDFTKAPTLFPSGQFAPNCEWCGHQPVKNFYFIEHPEKKWTLAVGSECIAHFSNLSGDELGSQAAEGKARMLISGIQEQSRTLSREFLYTTTDSYGRSTSKWMLTEAKPIYEKLNATKGKIDKDSTKGTLMRWLKAKGTDAELLAVQYAELMGSDQAKSIMIKSRQSKLSSLEDKIGSKQYRDGPRFGPTKIYNYTETQIENFSKAAAKLKAEISGLSGEAVVAQSTTGQELFQSNEMPFNLVAETAEDIRKREEAEIKAENERKAKEAAAAKAENDRLQGNLFDQSPVAERIDTARADVDQSPTDAQKEAGNYRKGHVSIQGLAITIENPKGSVRSGTDEDGKAWTVEMKNDYGYLKRTEGKDGDQVDVFIGPDPESPRVFVVNQLRQKPGSPPNGFDEHKVMIGFPDQASAVEGYLGNYSPGWRVGPVAEMTMDEFKDWIANGDTSKPVKQAQSDKGSSKDIPKRKPKEKKVPVIDRLRNYFAPGRVIPTWSGFDRVIKFNASGEFGEDWSVIVQGVIPADGRTTNGITRQRISEIQWINDPNDRPRTHKTPPTEQEFRASEALFGDVPTTSTEQEINPAIADTRDDEAKMRDFLKENPNATMTEMVAVVPDQLKSWYAKQRQAARDLESRPQTSAESETNAQLAQKALDPVAANTDFGEKIGGARKDLAIATGGSTTKKIASSDTVPKWQKGYAIVQVMSDRRNPENAGRWTFQKTAEKPSFGGWNNAPVFNTEEEAKLALPAWIVTKKHRVMSASGNGDKYAIRRIVTDRKSVEIKTGFDTREEASKYLIDNALEILNTKTGFGEEILSPREDQKIYRKGTDRRTTNATQQMFMDTFAPRGVEFGNWITTDEGQEVLNHAYDGLLDLADVIGVPPKALFLNGDLALAFGARGQGLSGARAHYEPDRVVINLTKMSGAGSLAHEWMHAVDHYFARQEGRTRADWATNSDGTRSLMVKGTPETKNNIYVSSGKYQEKSGMREEVSKAWENFRQTMLKKTVQRDVDVAKLKKWQDRAAENLKDTLGRIRQYLATEQTYGTRKAPATADQLSRWDQAVEKLTSGNAGPLEWKMPKSIKQKLDQEDAKRDKAKKAGKFVGRSSVSFKHMWLNDAFEELSDIHKEVRNRSGLSGEKPVLDMAIFSYKDLLKRKSEFEMKEATATESASVPTDFVREAYLGDLGRVKDYWQEPWELAARAFSSYIEDKVKEKGAKSGFLSTGSSESDNIFFKMMYGFMPYPSGSERAEINKSLDNLFGTLQTKETDRGVALYSSPPVPQPGGNTTSGPGQHPLRAFVEPEGTDWGLYGRKVSKPGKDSWTTAERDAVAKTFDAAGIKPIMISPTTGQPIDDSFIISSADQKQLIAALLERRRDRQAKAKANGATQQKIDDFVEKAHKAQRGIGWALAKVVAAPARLISWAMPKGVAKALDVVGNNNIDKAFVSAIERAATGVASTDVAKGVAKAMNSLAGTKGGQVTAEIAQNLIHWAKKNFIPQSLWGKEFAAKIREMNVTKQFMTETSMDVIRALKGTEKFTDLMMPERWRTDTAMHERIWRVLDGQADVATLPKELHHTVKTLRELSRKAGLEAVRTGRMSLETFRAMDKEGYVTHYYDNDSEGIIDKIVRRVPVLKNQGYVHARRMEAWRIEDTQTKDPNAPNLNALVNFQPGKFRFSSKAHRDAFYEQFLREQVVETIKKSRPKGLSGSANQAISTLTPAQLLRLERLPADLRGYISRISEQQRGRWIKKRPLTQEEKEKAGLIMDPFYATARHILQMGHDNATAKFFNEVVKLPDVVSSTDIAGFKKIADDARFGALRGKYVREDLHEQLQEIANVNDSVMRIADNMLTLWKTGKTVLNPSTHFRNIMGNVAFSGLAGNNVLNPAKWENYRRSIRAIRDGGTDLKLLIENGITGNDFASAELAQALKRMLPNADLVDTEKGPMETIGMFLKGALNAGLGKAFDLYGIEDDFYKAATFFKYLQDGKTAEEAATETRKWFPYYDQIGTSGALKWTRRVVPFFSFQREALRIMGNAAKERPLMLTAQLSMFWGLTQLSMMALGLRDEDKEDVEKELRGHLKFSDAPVFSMLLPWRDSEGRLQQWDMSNVMPFANFLGRNVGFDRSEDPASSELLKLLTAQNPFVSLMTSHISNKDAYTGKPIWEDSMTPEEKRGKAFGHAWNVLVPPLMGTSLDVLKNAGTRTTNKSLETRNTPQAWARSIAGFDIRNASPDFYDAVDKYMTKHEMPGKPGGQWSSTPEYRARAELWGQLVQDEPDYRKAGALLKYLKTEHQETFDTPKALSGLLDTRNPLKALGADEKRKMTAAEVKADFLSSLSGETGDAVRKSLAEFERIKMQAPARLEKAKAFMK